MSGAFQGRGSRSAARRSPASAGFLALLLAAWLAPRPLGAGVPRLSPERTVALRLKQHYSSYAWDLVRPVRGDFNRDGWPDLAVLGSTAGDVKVAVFFGPIQGMSPLAVQTFRVDPSQADGLCALPARLEPESQDYPADSSGGGAREGYVMDPAATGLRLSAEACAPIHFYWNGRSKQLEWWRAPAAPEAPRPATGNR